MKLPRGITQTAKGWRITVRVKDVGLWQKRFPLSTPRDTVEAKLQEARLKLRAGRRGAPAGTLRADVTRYLTNYFGQRSGREERERHLELWIAALGANTWRSTLTREDVATILQQWRDAGLKPDTCNKRRAALLAMFNALDGKGGANPVRETKKFRVASPLPRGLSFALIAKALKQLPKCRTRARLKLMAYTGARPIQIRQITPDDWDDKHGTLLLRATEKGKGTEPHRVPLSVQAISALKEFEDTDAWGEFTSAPMARMWKVAAVKVGLPPSVRPYDLRHSFGTEIYRTTGDLRVTKDLMGHASLAMTERYTLAAIPERQRSAIDAFDVTTSQRKSPPKVATPKKQAKKRRK